MSDPARAIPPRQRGFTMVELVTTMIVIGILAALALPRFADRRAFDTRGFADEALAAVQYARKVAVASRRNVCVTVSGADLSLTMATLAGSAQGCTVDVVRPAGGSFRISTPAGVNFGSTFAVVFDGKGRPSPLAGASVVIQGDVAYTLSVEAQTGHAHVQ